jgi:nicotinamide riboside kinase
MVRVVFIGVPGSGKSTLAARVFAELKGKGANAELVDEVVRRDVQKNGPLKSIWEQYRTRQNQIETEDAVPDAVDVTVVDSGTLTPYFFACLYANHSDARQRLVLQDLYRYLLDDLYLKRYDLVFYLPGAGLIEDGTRFQTPDEIALLDQHMRLFVMHFHRVGNCHEIGGPFEKRHLTAIEHILRILPDRVLPP